MYRLKGDEVRARTAAKCAAAKAGELRHKIEEAAGAAGVGSSAHAIAQLDTSVAKVRESDSEAHELVLSWGLTRPQQQPE
jgi:hypothetical protein